MLNKKFGLLVLLSIVAFLFTTAFKSAPALNIQMLSVDFRHEKGVTFKFLVSGDLRKNSLKGNITVDGNKVRLHCNNNSDPAPKTVVCTADRGTAARFAGRPAIVSVGGFTFYFVVPARP